MTNEDARYNPYLLLLFSTVYWEMTKKYAHLGEEECLLRTMETICSMREITACGKTADGNEAATFDDLEKCYDRGKELSIEKGRRYP